MTKKKTAAYNPSRSTIKSAQKVKAAIKSLKEELASVRKSLRSED